MGVDDGQQVNIPAPPTFNPDSGRLRQGGALYAPSAR
jgi:hypothetical protein